MMTPEDMTRMADILQSWDDLTPRQRAIVRLRLNTPMMSQAQLARAVDADKSTICRDLKQIRDVLPYVLPRLFS